MTHKTDPPKYIVLQINSGFEAEILTYLSTKKEVKQFIKIHTSNYSSDKLIAYELVK